MPRCIRISRGSRRWTEAGEAHARRIGIDPGMGVGQLPQPREQPADLVRRGLAAQGEVRLEQEVVAAGEVSIWSATNWALGTDTTERSRVRTRKQLIWLGTKAAMFDGCRDPPRG